MTPRGTSPTNTSADLVDSSHELRYFLAEALWSLQRYQEAARAYEQVLAGGVDSKYTDEATRTLPLVRDRLKQLARGAPLYR